MASCNLSWDSWTNSRTNFATILHSTGHVVFVGSLSQRNRKHDFFSINWLLLTSYCRTMHLHKELNAWEDGLVHFAISYIS